MSSIPMYHLMDIWNVPSFAIMDKIAMNILKQVFLWKYIFVLLDKYLRLELQSHYVAACLDF